MHINDAGLALIKSFESFRAVAYQDRGGVWTQGFGHTSGVTAASTIIDYAQATAWLRSDVGAAERAVTTHITVPLTSNQFSALVSLVFNVGTGPLVGSIAELINQGEGDEAADHFLLWNKVRVNGKLVESVGLTRRRKMERALFLAPDSFSPTVLS